MVSLKVGPLQIDFELFVPKVPVLKFFSLKTLGTFTLVWSNLQKFRLDSIHISILRC